MARLYCNNDVSVRLLPLLKSAGHGAAPAVGLDLAGAGDEVQLLTAVQRDEILVTYNRRDFMLLHRAWILWPLEFGAALPPHRGILALDQVAPGLQLDALDTLLSAVSTEGLSNQMLWWHLPIGWSTLTSQSWERLMT